MSQTIEMIDPVTGEIIDQQQIAEQLLARRRNRASASMCRRASRPTKLQVYDCTESRRSSDGGATAGELSASFRASFSIVLQIPSLCRVMQNYR
ncbi:hypothetical protein [Shinella sp.]|uniref:hypothetical protein n=1 Tax=Shinella sp. TaxID=1870904 RepID=UPI0039E34AAB